MHSSPSSMLRDMIVPALPNPQVLSCTRRFEWVEMRKAARWGDEVMLRLPPPKVPRSWQLRLLQNLLSPVDLCVRWWARKQHKDSLHEARKAARRKRISHDISGSMAKGAEVQAGGKGAAEAGQTDTV